VIVGETDERTGFHDTDSPSISCRPIWEELFEIVDAQPPPPLEQSPRDHALGQAMAELDRLSADLLRLEERAQRLRVLLRNLSAP
jgi:hypothetical protein